MKDQHKPLTAGGIEDLQNLIEEYRICGDWTFFEREAVACFLPRLLSMLTPPPDAAVREAVEEAQPIPTADEVVQAGRTVQGLREGGTAHLNHIRAVQVLLRAVQATRLAGEQVEAAFREGYELGNDDGRNIDVFCHIKQHNPESNPDFAWEHSNTRRAASPEAFAVEVGK